MLDEVSRTGGSPSFLAPYHSATYHGARKRRLDVSDPYLAGVVASGVPSAHVRDSFVECLNQPLQHLAKRTGSVLSRAALDDDQI